MNMNISAVSQMNSIYGKIASGKRIQSAADDAAGLSIVNRLQQQSNGLEVGASNVKDGMAWPISRTALWEP